MCVCVSGVVWYADMCGLVLVPLYVHRGYRRTLGTPFYSYAPEAGLSMNLEPSRAGEQQAPVITLAPPLTVLWLQGKEGGPAFYLNRIFELRSSGLGSQHPYPLNYLPSPVSQLLSERKM